jgi:hypothetical protein
MDDIISMKKKMSRQNDWREHFLRDSNLAYIMMGCRQPVVDTETFCRFCDIGASSLFEDNLDQFMPVNLG